MNIKQVGFKPSKVDPCIYVWGSTIIIVYVDDCLIFSPNQKEDEKAFEDTSKKFDITHKTSDTNTVESYLRIKVDNYPDRSFRMLQPHLL